MSCQYPGCSRPVYPGSQFCSRSHRDNFNKNIQTNVHSSNGTSSATCQYPGCSKAVFPGSSYCSIGHRDAMNNRPNPNNTTPSTPQQGTNDPLPPVNSSAPILDGNSGNISPQVNGNNPTTSQGDTCIFPNCQQPVFPGSKFCSKKHRDAMPNNIANQCQYPGCSLPVYPGSSYCSKRHRDAAPSNSVATNTAQPSGTKQCQYPGCTASAFPGGSYCTKKHRDGASNAIDKAAGMCLMCRNKPKNMSMRSDFCSRTCGQNAISQAPILFQLAPGDENYQNVSHQFLSKWIKATGSPEIHKICKIYSPHKTTQAYEKYRASVEQRGKFKSRNLTEGNEQRRFHGTTRACSLGDNGKTNLCQIQGCALCGIIRTSYQLNRAGSKHPWHNGSPGRFGRGIYTSATSAKSNDYTQNKGSSSYKAMLLNKVVVGRGQKLGHEDPTLTDPPPGYDSIIGEPAGANFVSDLNYDELVVYREDAILPTYLIVYSV